MDDIQKLSWKIYDALKEKGAEIGNASVPIIADVIEAHLATQQTVAPDELQADDWGDVCTKCGAGPYTCEC